MELNTANFRILTTGFQTSYQSAFNDFQAQNTYNRFTTDANSTTREELYPFLGKSTGFREWVGDRVAQNIGVHGYSIRNKKFENTVEVERDAIDDDEYGIYTPMFTQLGQDASEHPDILVYQALQQGGTLLCYDGKPFFSDSHPGVDANRKKTTYSNDMGGTGPTWYLACTKRALRPLIFQTRRPYKMRSMVDDTNPKVFEQDKFTFGVDVRCNVGFGMWQSMVRSRMPLTADNYAAARAAMLGFLRDDGQPWNFVPDTVLTGPNLEGQANTVAKAQLVAVTVGDTAVAADNIWQGTVDPLMSARITW